uniref:Uncharacterized protein n=1 Tax=Anguilla anguilla TaxID=7936 RepID=A0A0E9X8R9_ANGAN
MHYEINSSLTPNSPFFRGD